MPGVYVTKFFAPANAKRPANFVVIKYFLLGLLISNSIESILIIPKILDVRDESKILAKEMDEIEIKREEVKDLVVEKEREIEEIEKEKERELKVLLAKEAIGKHHKSPASEEEEEEEYEEEEEHRGKGRNEGHERREGHEKAEEEEKEEWEVRKRPQRKETGTNPVAVFMLFYGSVTLCLGVTAVFKESAFLLAGLIAVSVAGIVTILSASFSLLMIMSVMKDIIIAGLSYYYRMMIVMSDNPTPGVGPGMGVMPGQEGNLVVDYSQPSAAGVYVDPTIQQPSY